MAVQSTVQYSNSSLAIPRAARRTTIYNLLIRACVVTVAMGGALRWTPLSTAATGEPFGAVFEEPIAEIIASSALRDEMSVRPGASVSPR
eukprot:COSAG02_NODE_2900_length_7779_cov_3.635547_3_plen_90_part_00